MSAIFSKACAQYRRNCATSEKLSFIFSFITFDPVKIFPKPVTQIFAKTVCMLSPKIATNPTFTIINKIVIPIYFQFTLTHISTFFSQSQINRKPSLVLVLNIPGSV